MKPILQKVVFCSFFLLTAWLAVAQQTRVFIDTYSSQKAWRNREGGGEPVAVDTVTALPELLQRLSSNWQFVATGKGYWIGYPDEMYSIAAHGEVAIAPLLALAQHAPNEHTRLGAVYTLHLIGIESREAGRDYENFKSLPARQALRSLVADTIIGVTAIQLLVRDPWQSDVPVLMAALAQGSDNNWALVNALWRYVLPDYPVLEKIPDYIGSEEVRVPGFGKKRDSWGDYPAWVQAVLRAAKTLKTNYITVEEGLDQLPVHKAGDSYTIYGGTPGRITIRSFLYSLTQVEYTSLGSRLHYYLDIDGLAMCSTATARRRVLAWWQAQPQAYKQQFSSDKAKYHFLPFRF